jgi:hypothetical protein
MADKKPGPREKNGGWKTVGDILRVLGAVLLGFVLLAVVAVGLILGICTLAG